MHNLVNLLCDYFQKKTDPAYIASAGAAVGIGLISFCIIQPNRLPSPQDAIPRRISAYREELGLTENMDCWDPDRYIEEISRILEFRFYDQNGVEALPGGHSWVELAKTVISSRISPDLTDIDILGTAYCVLLDKGPSNEMMTEAMKILLLWQHGFSIS